MRRDVTFKSQGEDCKGWLFVPDDLKDGAKAPAIVLANGFSTVKEIYMQDYAERFVAAGFIALAFDYRHFGESGGEPRQQLFPQLQVDDIRNAISWLTMQPEVDGDKIGLWGVSLGGGHAIYMPAFDHRIKAAVATVPAVNQPENFAGVMPREAFDGLIGMLNGMRMGEYMSGQRTMMTLVAPEGEQSLMPQEAYDFYMKAQSTVAPNWRNEITSESLEKFIEYDPAGPIHLVSPCALMLVVGEDDVIIPSHLAKAAFERCNEPKELVLLPCLHTGIYPGYSHFEESVGAATRWFTTHLMGK